MLAGGLAVYVVLPNISGLDETWQLVRSGHPTLLIVAVALEVLSFGSYLVAFRRILVREGSPIGWRGSYEITMAGVAATRLLATAGVGGIALTAWALGRSGLPRGEVTRRLTAFYVVMYGLYLAALLVFGAGLWAGVLGEPAPLGVTLFPALFAAVLISSALALALSPAAPARPLTSKAKRRARLPAKVVSARAAVGEGVRDALDLLRRGDVALLAAAGWWAFDIGVLWSCLAAFGDAPGAALIVMAYFTGMLGNLLPLPGGIGGVEGGLVGALIAFGVDGGLAVVAVLSYRAFAFWLPTLPGLAAYVGLRRRVARWDAAAH